VAVSHASRERDPAQRPAPRDSLQSRATAPGNTPKPPGRAQTVHAQQAEAAEPSRQQLLTVSLYTRLQAQLATMLVIEQASKRMVIHGLLQPR
jgi:hypothetical protein